MSTTVLDRLTQIAHELWQERMSADGWKCAQCYDEQHRLHDALRSFNDLSRADQEHARIAVQASGVVEQLAACLDYPRGPDAPAPWDALTEGCRVRLVGIDATDDLAVQPGDIGVVETVTQASSGRTLELTVRWPSGERTVHIEEDGDLAIAD